MKNYHNIESLKPLTIAKTFPYIGYSKSGHKYYGTRQVNKTWRFALVISIDQTLPYFYSKTLADVSKKLETI